MLAKGETGDLATGFKGSTTRFGDIATAFYSGLWAYDGWQVSFYLVCLISLYIVEHINLYMKLAVSVNRSFSYKQWGINQIGLQLVNINSTILYPD